MPSQLTQARCRPSFDAAFLHRIEGALQFLQAWLRDPRAMAAVAPSGRALAALITRDIHRGSGRVLELGSGTGVFAAALLGRGVAERDLTLLERDPVLARRLARQFPAAAVLPVDAAEITIEGSERFGATICGLGLLAMPAHAVETIVSAAFRCMAADGALYLFTYGRRCSVPPATLARLGLTAQRVGTAWRNLPPASVFRLSRAGTCVPVAA